MNRKTFIIAIALFVGLLHFIIGPRYNGLFNIFISSYLLDILLPFVIYFLFTQIKFLQSKILTATIVFLIAFTAETLQYFNIPLFGSTFDPLDYLMYLLGVALALILDIKIISKLK